MSGVSRRSFLAASAVSAGLLGLAGCEAPATGGTTGEATGDALAAPAADAYPIDPDGEDVEAKWSSEEVRDGWTRYTNPDGGAELGVMDAAKVIQVDGYAFKDLNGNGKLDLYEDWRQSDEARAEALADELTAEEILPLMWNNGFTSTAAPLDEDSVELLKQGMRAGVSRAQASPDNYAGAVAWINAVQEWCEATRRVLRPRALEEVRPLYRPRLACHGRPREPRPAGRRGLQYRLYAHGRLHLRGPGGQPRPLQGLWRRHAVHLG